MKVHDLISGSEVELPTTGVHSGRYRLSKACILNGNVQLSAGSILWRVGAGSARFSPKENPDQGVTVRFMCPSDRAEASNVVEQAIAAVIGTHENTYPAASPHRGVHTCASISQSADPVACDKHLSV